MIRHLSLATISFMFCFATWGLVGAFGTVFRQSFGLSSTQAALLVVVPVLLGSLARIPAGMLTDRFGGRAVFASLMVIVAVAATIVPQVATYGQLLASSFFLGPAGSSFAVGVGYVSGLGDSGTTRKFRTAGFVVVAALMRPAGEWLSDRIGGARVLPNDCRVGERICSWRSETVLLSHTGRSVHYDPHCNGQACRFQSENAPICRVLCATRRRGTGSSAHAMKDTFLSKMAPCFRVRLLGGFRV